MSARSPAGACINEQPSAAQAAKHPTQLRRFAEHFVSWHALLPSKTVGRAPARRWQHKLPAVIDSAAIRGFNAPAADQLRLASAQHGDHGDGALGYYGTGQSRVDASRGMNTIRLHDMRKARGPLRAPFACAPSSPEQMARLRRWCISHMPAEPGPACRHGSMIACRSSSRIGLRQARCAVSSRQHLSSFLDRSRHRHEPPVDVGASCELLEHGSLTARMRRMRQETGDGAPDAGAARVCCSASPTLRSKSLSQALCVDQDAMDLDALGQLQQKFCVTREMVHRSGITFCERGHCIHVCPIRNGGKPSF